MRSLLLSNPNLQNKSRIEKKNHILRLKLVKELIARGGMTNAAICKVLQISAPKSMELIASLTAADILEQNEKGRSIGGRKPVLNKIKPETYYILCAEIDLYRVKLLLIDNTYAFIRSTSVAFTLSRDWSSAPQLGDLLTDFLLTSNVPGTAVLAIGISMPGLINQHDGRNHTYMTTADGQQSLREYIGNRFGKPAFIINDVKSAAIAELNFGLARNRKDVLVILMDWGIGLGVIMDGKLRSGAAGFSGEVGHIPFADDGTLCYCGKRGCLETVASGVALARMAKEGIQSGIDSLLSELAGQELENIEPRLVIDAATHGDQYAINLLSQTGENLGKGIATLIQVFNPELVILSGKIAAAKEYITLPIQHAVNTYCMTTLRDLAEIKLSQLGPDAAGKGIAYIVFEMYFDNLIARLESDD